MANVYAVKSGNWSDTTLWNTAALPATVDDVWSNNFLVYVDGNYQVISVRNKAATGINAGGGFILNNGVSLSANVEGSGATGGTNACVRFLSAAPSFATIVGNISSNNTAIAVPVAVFHNGTGTLNIIGNCLSGINNGTDASNGYIDNSSTGIINIRGDITGGSATVFGIDNNSTGTINITGNVFAGLGATAVYISVGGNINIIGNLIGQNNVTALVNNGTTTTNIFVSGNVLANTGLGISNNARGILTVYGYVSGAIGGGVGANNRYGISNTGTLFLSGNAYGGGVNNDTYGIYNTSTGNLYMTGNSFGANTAAGDRAYGILHNGTGDAIIYGNAYGGLRNGASGIGIGQNNPGTTRVGAPVATIYGNVYGGAGSSSYGALIDNNSSLKIFGNVIAGTGTTSYGVVNNAAGYVEVNGLAVGNDFGLGSSGIQSVPGIFGSQTGITIIRGLSCGPRGQWPTAGNVFIVPQSTSTATLFTSASAAQVLFTALSTNIVPPASSVRLGTRYNLNDYTGTCNVPSVSSVLQGVSVDNSIGVAALQPQTIWNYSVLSATDVNSLGGRLKEVATVQSIGQQLTALN